MSRFADPKATERYVLGSCECDGTPHDEDYLDLRVQLSGIELLAIDSAGVVERLEILVAGWNLIDNDEPAPIDREHLERLSLPTLRAIGNWWSEKASSFTLPNGSGAPSRNGSRGSASRTRTTPTNG